MKLFEREKHNCNAISTKDIEIFLGGKPLKEELRILDTYTKDVSKIMDF